MKAQPGKPSALAATLLIVVTASLGALTCTCQKQTEAPARPPLRVLVMTKTAGFRHSSIPAGVEAMKTLGNQHGFEVKATEDAAAFNGPDLGRYAVVVFLNTTGDILNRQQEAALESFIRGGGGFVGVHAATDTEYDWAWYGRLVGARFASHPAVQPATVRVVDRAHPSTRHLPRDWPRRDEWYNFAATVRQGIRVLAKVDESTYSGGTMGDEHAFAWCHAYDGGRAWYTAGGHSAEHYAEPLFVEHLLGGILWAAGVR